MKKDTRELLSEIHQNAAEIQRLTVLMLTAKRVGNDWRLTMGHLHSRLDTLIERLGQ